MTSSSTLLLQREEVTVDLVELIGTRFPGMGMLYIWGNFSCSQLLFVILKKNSFPTHQKRYNMKMKMLLLETLLLDEQVEMISSRFLDLQNIVV